jgi:hypothetical protein
MPREIDITNLSFIDLLSCGLGAVLLLLLLFAVSIRTTALQSLEAEAKSGAQSQKGTFSAGSLGGTEIPPPEPTQITLTWSAPTQLPLQLEVVPPGGRAMTEDSPFSRNSQTDALVTGFFVRSESDELEGGSVQCFLPRSRTLLERLKNPEECPLNGWEIRVHYPRHLNNRQSQIHGRLVSALNRFESSAQWEGRLVSPRDIGRKGLQHQSTTVAGIDLLRRLVDAPPGSQNMAPDGLNDSQTRGRVLFLMAMGGPPDADTSLPVQELRQEQGRFARESVFPMVLELLRLDRTQDPAAFLAGVVRIHRELSQETFHATEAVRLVRWQEDLDSPAMRALFGDLLEVWNSAAMAFAGISARSSATLESSSVTVSVMIPGAVAQDLELKRSRTGGTEVLSQGGKLEFVPCSP